MKISLAVSKGKTQADLRVIAAAPETTRYGEQVRRPSMRYWGIAIDMNENNLYILYIYI